jgi:hypothetical protein
LLCSTTLSFFSLATTSSDAAAAVAAASSARRKITTRHDHGGARASAHKRNNCLSLASRNSENPTISNAKPGPVPKSSAFAAVQTVEIVPVNVVLLLAGHAAVE